MAQFEGYERREAKILATLKEFGIPSIDACKEICDKAGIDPYKIVEETQPICFENAKWAYTVGAAIAIKKGCVKAKDAAAAIVGLCARRLPAFLRTDFPARDIQVLSPTKKSGAGVYQLNALLQQALNPPAPAKPELAYGDMTFRLGDKVMHVRNNYQLAWVNDSGAEGEGVFNGDVGFVSRVDEQDKTVTVRYDDERSVEYYYQQLEELELAYCLSVHKSQGSEFPCVVMPVVGGPPRLLTRNLFYTALTRARRLVVLVGREENIAQMVQNNLILRRYTTLRQRLEEEWEGIS